VVAMTAELTVRFVAPVELQVPVVLRAALVRSRGAVFFLQSELVQDTQLRARATAKFVVRDRASAAPLEGRTATRRTASSTRRQHETAPESLRPETAK